jgi:hypothetical protein
MYMYVYNLTWTPKLTLRLNQTFNSRLQSTHTLWSLNVPTCQFHYYSPRNEPKWTQTHHKTWMYFHNTQMVKQVPVCFARNNKMDIWKWAVCPVTSCRNFRIILLTPYWVKNAYHHGSDSKLLQSYGTLNFVLVRNHQQTAWWHINQLRGDINMNFFSKWTASTFRRCQNTHTINVLPTWQAPAHFCRTLKWATLCIQDEGVPLNTCQHTAIM